MQHLQLIIAIAGAVAWWLSQSKRTGPAEGGEGGGKTFADPELAERTRRIREEIQRKIEQRSRGYTAPAGPAPAPDPELAGLPPFLRQLVENQLPEPPPVIHASTARLEAAQQAEILEQQATLVERLQEAKEMEAAAGRRVKYEKEVAGNRSVAMAAMRKAVKSDLKSTESLRRALILREILGPPVALR